MLLALALLAFAGATPGTSAGEPEPTALPRAASFRPRILLVARLDTAALGNPRRLAEIADEVAAIWRPYLDVAIVWPGGLLPRGLDDRLELVITDRLPAERSPTALGWIEFSGPSQPARALTVSVDAARRLAGQAPLVLRPLLARGDGGDRLVARALARGVAHELGHYLLQTPRHADAGLMRAHFTPADILGPGGAPFRLDPAQRAQLAERLQQYARAGH
jgi:hypothetical protein